MRVTGRIEGRCEEEVSLRKVCQESRTPEEGRRYSWLEGRLERLEGKEARHEYYARLEERPASPRVQGYACASLPFFATRP